MYLHGQIPFGMDSLDRDDCDGDPCDPTIETEYGAPVWDVDFDDIQNE